MFFSTTIALLVCISAASLNALEKCPGVSNDSEEDFKVKYDAAPIVVYGTVSEVKANAVILTITCTLKGSVLLKTIDLSQFPEVQNLTECHYLTANKNYIVYLDSMKTSSPDGKSIYRLADFEEIEINTNTMKNFLNNECSDEDDNGIEMTMFYFDNKLKCNQFTAMCNEANKPSLLALNYSPLTQSTTFLGGFKKELPIPNAGSDDESISGKQNGGTDDEQLRGVAPISAMWVPLIVFLTGLIMTINM